MPKRSIFLFFMTSKTKQRLPLVFLLLILSLPFTLNAMAQCE